MKEPIYESTRLLDPMYARLRFSSFCRIFINRNFHLYLERLCLIKNNGGEPSTSWCISNQKKRFNNCRLHFYYCRTDCASYHSCSSLSSKASTIRVIFWRARELKITCLPAVIQRYVVTYLGRPFFRIFVLFSRMQIYVYIYIFFFLFLIRVVFPFQGSILGWT